LWAEVGNGWLGTRHRPGKTLFETRRLMGCQSRAPTTLQKLKQAGGIWQGVQRRDGKRFGSRGNVGGN
jgi:hypothetical protein